MSAAWLTLPLELTGSREFECDDLSTEQCDYYKQHWHFWYVADHAFALPTVAIFLCAISLFILGRAVSSLLALRNKWLSNTVLRKAFAVARYLSYRGFHVKRLGWNSAPLGVLLLGLAGAVFFFCMDLIPQPYYWPSEIFGNSPPLATRSGWMALACMPFVFATASKTNWITLFTGVSHERLQVFHRWISYAFFVLALMHTFPFIVYHIHWHDMEMHFADSLLFYWTGIVAIIFQAWLTFASHSSIRAMGYEMFKISHFIAVIVFMLTFFWHCDYTLTSWHYFIATAAIYVPCYLYSWLRTCFEHGVTSKARVSVEDNGFIRVAIPSRSDWSFGQHCFLRFTGLGFMQAISTHPFTICSLPTACSGEQPELVFYIRHGKGLTASLHKHAVNNLDAPLSVLVDGPYGGVNMQRYNSTERALLIAGGSGAGWCLPFIEQFARNHISPGTTNEDCSRGTSNDSSHEDARGNGYGKPLSMRVILVTRDIGTRTWFLQTVADILSKCSAIDLPSTLRLDVHVTGAGAAESHSSSMPSGQAGGSLRSTPSAEKIPIHMGGLDTAVPGKESLGRPPLPLIIHQEADKAAEDGESLSVFVCGPSTMQNDVRNAVAKENLDIVKGSILSSIYLHSEHFSWA